MTTHRAIVLASLTLLALAPPPTAGQAEAFEPHVIVGVPDSGINPYHKTFYRPERTAHPCTYIPDFPCSLPALELTLGGNDYKAALDADRAKWAAIGRGDAFWIPRTVFVAVVCDEATQPSGEYCILDEDGHGTGTTSSIISENPDALIAFKEGSSRIQPILDAGIPVDIFSESWGNVAPIPGHPSVLCLNYQASPLFVTAAGNDPRSMLTDCRKGEPSLITVGGAYAQSRSTEPMAGTHAEVVSYYCRPTATPGSAAGTRSSFCGTSFATPTVAGALSEVVLGLRRASGYTGNLQGDVLDPILGVTVHDLRDALNRTASYEPTPEYPNRPIVAARLATGKPWLEWGWGFYDGLVADATLAHLLGTVEAPEKPAEAREYMATLHAAKRALYGPLPAS